MGAAAANGGAGAAKVASKTPQAQAPLPLEQAAHPKLAQDDQAEAYDHDKERAARQARRDELKEYRRTIEQLPLNHWWESPGRCATPPPAAAPPPPAAVPPLQGLPARPGLARGAPAASRGRAAAALPCPAQPRRLPAAQPPQPPPRRLDACRPTTVFGLRHYGHPSALEGRRAARDEVPFLFKAFESGQQPPPRPGTKRAELPRAATIHEYLDWTVTASEPEDPDELVSRAESHRRGKKKTRRPQSTHAATRRPGAARSHSPLGFRKL
jgi:hypothetical protein